MKSVTAPTDFYVKGPLQLSPPGGWSLNVHVSGAFAMASLSDPSFTVCDQKPVSESQPQPSKPFNAKETTTFLLHSNFDIKLSLLLFFYLQNDPESTAGGGGWGGWMGF